MKKQNLGILIPLFLTFLAGCALLSSSKKEFYPAAGLENEKPSPRATPAQVTQESGESLKKKGFVAIGQISEKVVTGTYRDSSKQPDKAESRDVTTGLLRQAADRGGDVVTLQQNNSAERMRTQVQGRALTWRRESREEAYQYQRYTGDPGYQKYRTVYSDVPTSWEMVGAYEYSVVSSGTVWRNDPELARRLAEWEKAAPERAKAAAESKKAAAELAKKERIAARQDMAARQMQGENVTFTGTGYYVSSHGVFPEGLKPFMNADELFGYADRNGTTVIKPQFSFEAGNFSDGLARVFLAGKAGKGNAYIDRTGKPVVVPQFEFRENADFSEGMARVGVGTLYSTEKWGYIDKTGQLVIPAQFDTAGDFSEGLAKVRIKGSPDKWGYIDKQGRYAIPPQFYFAGDFREGLAPVYMLMHPGVKTGYIDPSGKWIITDTQFTDAREFSEGLAPVRANLGSANRPDFQWGYIDKGGKWVIKAQFHDAFPFSDGLARVAIQKGFTKAKYGFIDRTGKIVVERIYDKANDFRGGLAVAWPVWGTGTVPKMSPGKILNKAGEAVGVLDVLGAVRWNSQPQGSR